MYNIIKFDEYSEKELINENFLNDVKNKIINWWKNFQNKEELSRKINFYFTRGYFIISFLYIFYQISTIFNKDLLNYSKANNIDQIFFYIYMVLLLVYNTGIYKFRKKLIKNKLDELRDEFKNNTFKNSIFLVMGDRKNINSAINRLKNDNILNDNGILQTNDITLVDLTEKFGYYSYKKEIDPYDEEEWGDDDIDYNEIKLKSTKRENIIKELEDLYDVQFRKIVQITDLNDKGIKKNSKKNPDRYLRLKNKYDIDYGIINDDMKKHEIILDFSNRNINGLLHIKNNFFYINNTKFIILRTDEKNGIVYAYPEFIIPKSWLNEIKDGYNINIYITKKDIKNYNDELFDKYE